MTPISDDAPKATFTFTFLKLATSGFFETFDSKCVSTHSSRGIVKIS